MSIKPKIGLAAREDGKNTQDEIEKASITFTLPDTTKEAYDQMMNNYQDELTQAQPKRRQIWNAASDQGLAEIQRQGRIRAREEQAYQDAQNRSKLANQKRLQGDTESGGWWNPLGALSGLGNIFFGENKYNPETRQYERSAPTSWKEATTNILRNIGNTATGLRISGNGKGGVMASFDPTTPNRWRAVHDKNQYAPHEAWENAQDQLLQQSLDPNGIQPLRPWTFDADYPTVSHPLENLMLKRAADEEDFREKKAHLDRVSALNGWGEDSPERQRYMEYLFNVTPTEEQEGDRAAAAILKAGGTEEEANEARQNVIRSKFNLKPQVSKQADEFEQALIKAGVSPEDALVAKQKFVYASENQTIPLQLRALMLRRDLIARGATEEQADAAVQEYIYHENNLETPEEKEMRNALEKQRLGTTPTSRKIAKDKVSYWRTTVPKMLADPKATPEELKEVYTLLSTAIADPAYAEYLDTTFDSKENELTGLNDLRDKLWERITKRSNAPGEIADLADKFSANAAGGTEVGRQENIAIVKKAKEKSAAATPTVKGVDVDGGVYAEKVDIPAAIEKNAPYVQILGKVIDDDLVNEYNAHKETYDGNPRLLTNEIMARLEANLDPVERAAVEAPASRSQILTTALLLLYRMADKKKAKDLEKGIKNDQRVFQENAKTNSLIAKGKMATPQQDSYTHRYQLNLLDKPHVQ